MNKVTCSKCNKVRIRVGDKCREAVCSYCLIVIAGVDKRTKKRNEEARELLRKKYGVHEGSKIP